MASLQKELKPFPAVKLPRRLMDLLPALGFPALSVNLPICTGVIEIKMLNFRGSEAESDRPALTRALTIAHGSFAPFDPVEIGRRPAPCLPQSSQTNSVSRSEPP